MGSFLLYQRLGCSDDALFLQGTDSLGTELHANFLAVDNQGLDLEIWLPNLLGVALREANVAAVLLALTGEITLLHTLPYISFRFRC